MFVNPDSTTSSQIAHYYDRLDQHYRIVWGSHLHHGLWQAPDDKPQQATIHLIDYATQWLRLGSTSHIADVGCGYGATANYVSERFGCAVTGYTLSRKQCQMGEAMGLASKVKLKEVDWLAAALQPSSFDGIISLECLCHVPNKRRFLSRVQHALKPGCRAVITALAVTSDVHPILKKTLLSPLCQKAQISNLGTSSNLELWARNSGLHVIKNANLTQKVRRTWPTIIARAAARIPKAWAKKALPFPPSKQELLLGLNAVRMMLCYALDLLEYRALVVEKS